MCQAAKWAATYEQQRRIAEPEVNWRLSGDDVDTEVNWELKEELLRRAGQVCALRPSARACRARLAHSARSSAHEQMRRVRWPIDVCAAMTSRVVVSTRRPSSTTVTLHAACWLVLS